MNAIATVQSSEHETPLALDSLEQLDQRLDCIAASRPPDSPTIVEVCVHQHALSFGLGLPQSFVQIQSESRMPPYLVTIGDAGADGVVTFYFMGNHHTEIECRHLIPITLAREVIREFFDTAKRSERVEWEKI